MFVYRADRSKRSTMFSVDDKQAADWQKSKEARGDWYGLRRNPSAGHSTTHATFCRWHMMDKARGAGGEAIFGENSPQQTWSGKDRGTQVTPEDADYAGKK